MSVNKSIHLSEPRATPCPCHYRDELWNKWDSRFVALLAMPRTSPEASVVDSA